MVDDLAIDDVFKKYEGVKDHKYGYFLKLDLPVLIPSQINLFFQTAIKRSKDSKEEWTKKDYELLNWLIFDSWSHGHNDFKLNNQKDYAFGHLFNGLNGDKENPISITFKGKSGGNFARDSKNCIYNLDRDIDFGFSTDSENCTYNLNDEFKIPFIMSSKNCTYNFHERSSSELLFNNKRFESNTYNFFKKIKSIDGCFINGTSNCTFNIYDGIDKTDFWETIENCTIRTPELGTYEKIISSFKEYNENKKEKIRDGKIKTRRKKIKIFSKKDNNVIEETLFFDYYSHLEKNSTRHNKIQLIK